MANKTFKDFLLSYQNQIIASILIVTAFGVGLILPSPFFREVAADMDFDEDTTAVRDTTNMKLPDGSVYEGSINAKTRAFQGYGVLVKGNSNYEGNWKNGKLPYGKRTTPQSVYEGRFNKDLDNDGFGIINYTSEYIAGKRKQGKPDNEITATYIGNWKKNVKTGLGRSIMVDSSMEFGNYKEGIIEKVPGAEFQVGSKVYGIDVSRHQIDIDWNNLALFCDAKGNVFTGKPKETKYMQPVFFVYIKATEGSTVKDKTYDLRTIEAERHGIAKGAYHFLRLGSPVEDQIKNFLETAKWTAGDMPPALDVEVESEIEAHGVAKLLEMTFTWLETVEEKLGVRPIIYTRESIRDSYLAKDPRFRKYQYWIARYHPDGPKKDGWLIWQMSENGRVKGYEGTMDIDLYNGDFKSFEGYLKSIERGL